MAEMPELYSKKSLHQDIEKAVSGKHRAKAKAIIRKKLIEEATKLRISLKKIAQHATDRVSSELRKRKGNAHLYKLEGNSESDKEYNEAKQTLFVSSPNQIPSQLKSSNSGKLSVPVSVRSLTHQVGESHDILGIRFKQQTMLDLADSFDKKQPMTEKSSEKSEELQKRNSEYAYQGDTFNSEIYIDKIATGPTILMPTISENGRGSTVLLHSNECTQVKDYKKPADMQNLEKKSASITDHASTDIRYNNEHEKGPLKKHLNTQRLPIEISKKKSRNIEVPRLHLNTQRLITEASNSRNSFEISQRGSGKQRHTMDSKRMKPDILRLDTDMPKTGVAKFQLERGLDQDSSIPRHRRKRMVSESLVPKMRLGGAERPNRLEQMDFSVGKLEGSADNRRMRSVKLALGMKPKKAQLDSVSAKPLSLGFGFADNKAGKKISFMPSSNHESNWKRQNRRVNKRMINSQLTPRGFNPLPKTQKIGTLTFSSSFSTPRTKTMQHLKPRSRKANPRKGLTIGF